MKALLGGLLCLVLGTSQAFALKGGPDYGTAVRTNGIYAGVLLPGALSPGVNSIGLFSLTIPRAGLGTGSVVIFTAGETYLGTFQGTADPDNGKLYGEINASFPYTTVIGGDTVQVIATAAGQVHAVIRANRNVFSPASSRIVGDALVQFSLTVNNPFTQIDYDVIGFKQQEL